MIAPANNCRSKAGKRSSPGRRTREDSAELRFWLSWKIKGAVPDILADAEAIALRSNLFRRAIARSPADRALRLSHSKLPAIAR